MSSYSAGNKRHAVELFKQSTLWRIDFTFDGHPRQWTKAYPAGDEPRAAIERELSDLHGARAVLTTVRLATPEEEAAYVRDELPGNALCPTGRR